MKRSSITSPSTITRAAWKPFNSANRGETCMGFSYTSPRRCSKVLNPRRWGELTIPIVRSQITMHVVRNALFQGRKWAFVAGCAQALHARLREILVFLDERRRHVDEFDRRRP